MNQDKKLRRIQQLSKLNAAVHAEEKRRVAVEGCTFRYHPNPLATGNLYQLEEQAPCDSCGNLTGIGYDGAFYWTLDDDAQPTFCPTCIQSGRASQKGDCEFTPEQGCPDIGDPAKQYEVSRCTPGYNCIQQERWLTHCGDYCAYIGELYGDEVTDTLREELSLTWLDDNSYQPDEVVWGTLGFDFEGQLFQCLHCGAHILLVERD